MGFQLWQFTGSNPAVPTGTIVLTGGGVYRVLSTTDRVNLWRTITGQPVQPCGDIAHWNDIRNGCLSGFIEAGLVAAY